MAVPVRKASEPRAPAPSGSASGLTGWIAVMISVGVSAFVAVFAGAESAAEGAVMWGETLLLAVVTGTALAAVTVRNGGVAYAVLGALALLFLDGVGALLISIPMMVAGVLFLSGTPRPRGLAIGIMVAAPVLVAIVSAIVMRMNLA